MQEALFEAYRKLDKFDDSRPIKPWLFRIAKTAASTFCDAGEYDTKPRRLPPRQKLSRRCEAVLGTGKAVEHLVLTLPPKERACVLLEDVFDYSLEEIAELVGSTVGGVKAALNRDRTKRSRERKQTPR